MSVVISSASETTSKNAVADWVKVFPKQAAETYTGSVNFMKQLTVVAASTITYLRNEFPEENYTKETFGGLKLMILKKNCEDELAQFVSTALLQAFDAFEKKYLHQLAICYYSGDCCLDNLVEYYVFEYSYSDDGVSMNVLTKSRGYVINSEKCTFQTVRSQTLRMMRSLRMTLENCTNTLSLESTDISIRLYYNEDAPAGYQAPGFLSPLESQDHLAGPSGACIKLGTVETQHHKLSATAYTRDIADNNDRDLHSNLNTAGSTDKEMDFEQMEEAPKRASAPVAVLRCPCDKNDVDDTCAILICKYCGFGGHSVCYGYRGDDGESDARAHHCCDSCANADPARRPTDAMLHQFSPNKKGSLCILRRALWLCWERGEVSAPALAQHFQLSQATACKVMKLLRTNGILVTGDDDDLVSPRKVLRKQLENAMNKYFQKEAIVEQLRAESLPPDNDVDPVGDVLKPMEKISLRNATTLAQIIEPTPPKNVIENSTLVQYKEAILSNEKIDDELPLSGSHNPVKNMDKFGKKSAKRKNEEGKKPRIAVTTKKIRVASK